MPMHAPSDNFDYQAEQDALLRRQKLLAVMQQQAMQTPVVGTSNGIGQALAKMGQMYFNAKADQGITEKQAQLADKRQIGLAAGLKDYMNTQNGVAGTSPPDELGGGPPSPDIPPDPHGALLKAMTSRYPELQAIGAMQIKNSMPEVKTLNDQLVSVVPGTGAVKRLGDFRSGQVVNNQVVDPANPSAVQADLRDSFNPVGKIGVSADGKTPVIGQTEKTTAKATFAPVGTTVNVNNAGELATTKALGEKTPDVLAQSAKAAQDAITTVQRAQRITKILEDPAVQTGFASAPITGLAAVGEKLGFKSGVAVTKTQELISLLMHDVLENAKKVAPVSQADLPFIEMATSGKMQWTPQALTHLAGIAQAGAHNALMMANKQHEGAASQPGAMPGATMYPMPTFSYGLDPEKFDLNDAAGTANYKGTFNTEPTAPQPGAGGAPMPLDAYLNQFKK